MYFMQHSLLKETWLHFSCLKGLRHEDFAILGQFCAKIITYCPTHTQSAPKFFQGQLTIIIFWGVIFENIASKPIYSSLTPFPSLPSVATDDRKQFQYCKIVFNNKARPLLLEFS